jgi:hypothetical protein
LEGERRVRACYCALRDECYRIWHEACCKELPYEPLRWAKREATGTYDVYSV